MLGARGRRFQLDPGADPDLRVVERARFYRAHRSQPLHGIALQPRHFGYYLRVRAVAAHRLQLLVTEAGANVVANARAQPRAGFWRDRVVGARVLTSPVRGAIVP